jgi:hypothetical protein
MKRGITLRAVLSIAAAGVVLAGPALAQTQTVATFADPSANSANSLFTVNLLTDRITGGWADSQTGLNLNVVIAGITYPNAFFTLTDPGDLPGIAYTAASYTGVAGPGIVRFFADGANPATTPPLVRLDFAKATLSPGSLAADDLLSLDGVVITGSAVPTGLTQEAFAFAFANQAVLPNGNGFTATASFTSSAVPEPSMLVLLGCGLVSVLRRRRT